MNDQKKQMEEAAILYYEKKHTQQEIASMMHLSRQTVSKLLNEALAENIVEIKIHDPHSLCETWEREICDRFPVQNAVVCGVSSADETLRQLMTVHRAADYIRSYAEKGNQKIAISWGKTIQMLIAEFENIRVPDNVVFPLFGATDQEQSYYLSNELARSFADKMGAKVKYAWFPYRPDSREDGELFKKTSYYKKLSDLWNDIDLAILGIGNSTVIRAFGKTFGYPVNSTAAVGDISTHFFDENGQFLELYENTLCASTENLRSARQTVAVACGDDKAEAIVGALRTRLIDTLITDEYTARKILSLPDGKTV